MSENDESKKTPRPGSAKLLKTAGFLGLASALSLAAPGAAELDKAAQNLSLVRNSASEGLRSGHMVLDGVFDGLTSVEARSVCHTDSHSSSHTSGGGTDNHTSSRKRVLHQC